MGAVILFAFLAAFFLQQRYRHSLNFLPVHVQLAGIPLTDIKVHYQSQFGSWGEIPVDPRYEGRWMQSPSINGVVQLAIAGPTSVNWGDLQAEVRCGESWYVSTMVPLAIAKADSEILTERGRGVDVKFVSPRHSYIRSADGAINWQGDFLLVGVPMIQAIGLIMILRAIKRVALPLHHESSI